MVYWCSPLIQSRSKRLAHPGKDPCKNREYTRIVLCFFSGLSISIDDDSSLSEDESTTSLRCRLAGGAAMAMTMLMW